MFSKVYNRLQNQKVCYVWLEHLNLLFSQFSPSNPFRHKHHVVFRDRYFKHFPPFWHVFLWHLTVKTPKKKDLKIKLMRIAKKMIYRLNVLGKNNRCANIYPWCVFKNFRSRNNIFLELYFGMYTRFVLGYGFLSIKCTKNIIVSIDCCKYAIMHCA